MKSFLGILEEVLKKDERLLSEDGSILKSKAYDFALTGDTNLLSLLLSNADLKEHFFKDINGVMVFDSIKFGWVVNSKEFLSDSYTQYKNKIGLVNDKGIGINQSNDVCLVWPYKDCVIEGGQTKEDQKITEVFYNETLAPDEVNRLLYPKVFTNAKRFTRDGIENVSELGNNDNLIMKGNNLLALSSLLKRYESAIKCIFIDPPYYFVANKPSDSFSYNSNFKLSSWLVFMKNRIDIAYKLLKKNGIIYVTISDEGAHYLKVMMDGIFGMENFIADVTWESRKSISSDGLMSMNSNHVLVYAKSKLAINKNDFRLALDVESFKYDDKDGKGKYRLEPFDAPGVRKNLSYVIKNPNTNQEYIPPTGRHWRTELDTYEKYLSEGKIKFGVDGTARPQYKAYYEEVKKAGKGKATSSIWHNVSQSIIWQEIDTNTNATDDQVTLFGESVFTNPKPEELLKRAIELATNEDDYVLDFFMGSATTQAVALKMNRRFIGIEQMNYIDTVSIERLKKVISGEQTGISKEVNWQGGGSFIYCEIKELNETFMTKIQNAKSDAEITTIIEEIKDTGFISQNVLPKDIVTSVKEFTDLSFEDKRKFACEIINKNLLYINLCDIDDEEFKVTDEEKAFTNSFYRRG